MNFFPPEYIQYLLSLNLRGDARGGMANHGHHRSPHAGTSVEFHDFRPYVPGDDLRRIDVNIYQRHHKLFIRRYRHFQQATYRVILDNSASLHFEPERRRAAVQAAAAIAVVLLHHGNRVHLFITGHDAPRQLKNGQQDIPLLLQLLDGIDRDSGSDGDIPLQQLSFGLNRHAVTWIVSDFFADDGVAPLLAGWAQIPGTVIPVRIFRAADPTPQLTGNLQLVDCESGARLDAAVDAAAIRDYQQSYVRFIREIDAFARQTGAHHYALDADRSDLTRIAPLFPDGALTLN